MSEYLVDIKNERLSFFTPVGEVKALNDVSIHLREGAAPENQLLPTALWG